MAVLLHISDIHAGADDFSSCRDWVERRLADIIRKKKIDFLICSGDLSFKGESKEYEKAAGFIKAIVGTSDVQTILVPGNHDICKNEVPPFTGLDIVAERINESFKYRFSEKSCWLISTPEIDFFLTNSAHHGDYSYGEINIANLEEEIAKSDPGKKKILITHHPFLVEGKARCSAVINAREVLCLLGRNSFKAVLHGHQHSNSRFGYKYRDCIFDVIGTRSISLSSPSIPIGALLITIDDSEIKVLEIDMAKDAEELW